MKTELRTRAGRLLPREFARVVVAGIPFAANAQEHGVNSEPYLSGLVWRGVLVLPGETQFNFREPPDLGGDQLRDRARPERELIFRFQTNTNQRERKRNAGAF